MTASSVRLHAFDAGNRLVRAEGDRTIARMTALNTIQEGVDAACGAYGGFLGFRGCLSPRLML